MVSFWLSLSLPWQACLEQAWLAYTAGSLPIGAVILDADGAIIARGRTRRHDPRTNDGLVSGSKLAHAELNALISLPEDDDAFMPAEGRTPLTQRQVEIIRWWVRTGATTGTPLGEIEGALDAAIRPLLNAELGLDGG